MSSAPSSTDNAIIEVLNRFPQVQLAILFGSCAKGNATTASDLDLAVQADQPLDAELSVRLIGETGERLGRPVDLIDLRTAGEPLLGEVLKGRRLIGSDTSYARLITRHLLDAADFLPYRERIVGRVRKHVRYRFWQSDLILGCLFRQHVGRLPVSKESRNTDIGPQHLPRAESDSHRVQGMRAWGARTQDQCGMRDCESALYQAFLIGHGRSACLPRDRLNPMLHAKSGHPLELL